MHDLHHGPLVPQVESEQVCQTGLDEEAELHWKQDQAAAMLPCQSIKHTFARIARECTDVRFLSINVSMPRVVQQSSSAHQDAPTNIVRLRGALEVGGMAAVVPELQ